MRPLDEIRRLYFNATRATIQRDLTRAIALLRSMSSDGDRQRAAVYMDGLSQMRSEWGVRPGAGGGHGPGSRPRRTGATAARKTRRSRG